MPTDENTVSTEYRAIYLDGEGTSSSPYIVSGAFEPQSQAYYNRAYQSGTHRLYVLKNGVRVPSGTNIGVSDATYAEVGVFQISSNNTPTQFTLSDYSGFKIFENAAPYSGSGTLADPYITRSGCRLFISTSEVYVKPLSRSFIFYPGLIPTYDMTLKAYYLDGTSTNYILSKSYNYWQHGYSMSLEDVDYISLRATLRSMWIDFGMDYAVVPPVTPKFLLIYQQWKVGQVYQRENIL